MKVLKMYYERVYDENMRDFRLAKEALNTFGKFLEKKGWIDDMMEAGYVSPDLSTIFYYGRSPYFGQLAQFSAGAKANEKYMKIQKELEEYFVDIEA